MAGALVPFFSLPVFSVLFFSVQVYRINLKCARAQKGHERVYSFLEAASTPDVTEWPQDGFPVIRTSLPGPKSQVLLARQNERESNARTYPRRLPIGIAQACGSYLLDVDGNVFIDFLNGAGALPLGHAHPRLLAAAHRQLDSLTHGLDFPTPAKTMFTDELFGMLPDSLRGQMKVQFCGPTGSDGVEAALKLCKTATGRSDVVSFTGGFHGSSHSTMAVTGLRSPKETLPNLMPGVQFFPYAYCYRCPLGLTPSRCEINCAMQLEIILDDANGGVRLPAAVILEVVQGEGGGIPARAEFVREVRRITRERAIPLIIDEIQSGCGRTGQFFAFEHYAIDPDVIVLSKGLGGLGLPISVVLYRKELDTWQPGAHTGTFRGNQLAFAAGAEMLRIMRSQDVCGQAGASGARALARLRQETLGLPCVGDVRGLGLMIAIEIISPTSGRGDPLLAAAVQSDAFQHGLIFELGGRDDCVIRLLPALTVEAQVLDAALDILIASISRQAARLAA